MSVFESPGGEEGRTRSNCDDIKTFCQDARGRQPSLLGFLCPGGGRGGTRQETFAGRGFFVVLTHQEMRSADVTRKKKEVR